MTSPIIDEDVMMEALKAAPPTAIAEHAGRLRSGAALLLLDAFDRQVTRDQFMAIMGAAIELVDNVGRFQMVHNVKTFMQETGKVGMPDLEVTLTSLVTSVGNCTAQCTQMAKMLQECPRDEDKVH